MGDIEGFDGIGSHEVASDTHFKVRVNEPFQLFLQVEEKASKGQGVIDYVGSNQLVEDPLLDIVYTSLRGSNDGEMSEGGGYGFTTYLELSDGRTSQPDHGYYDTEKVSQVVNALEKAGVQGRLVQNLETGENEVLIEQDGQMVHVAFGYPTLEDRIKNTIPKWSPDGTTRKDFTESERAEMADAAIAKAADNPRKNDEIKITLIDKDQYAKYLVKRLLPLGTSDQFVESTQKYATTVEQVVNALYKVEGCVPPDVTHTIEHQPERSR